MEYSKSGLALTEGFESCALTAYRDIGGIWTIGWGHTGPDVTPGLVWTQEQADAQLQADTDSAQACVNAVVLVALTQPEFDALVDFVFNVGCTAFTSSTMLKWLNRGQYAQAAQQFDLWDHAAGQVVAGLLRRREAETQEFEGV
jgi:lysozyme